jgi:DMSO/TMAO reductase YedYZ molybdopterin-dependent catalytic subunit
LTLRTHIFRRRVSAVFIAAASLMLAAAISSAQTEPAPAAGIRVSGEVSHPLTLQMADLAAIPHHSVSVSGKHGAARYQGVAVVDLLRRAGAPLGAQLRGPKMRLYVLVKGRDGYAAVFALAEFDPAFTSRVILLADQRDGRPLGTVEGPLRIVVPDEQRYARWVRQVTDIEVGTAQ